MVPVAFAKAGNLSVLALRGSDFTPAKQLPQLYLSIFAGARYSPSRQLPLPVRSEFREWAKSTGFVEIGLLFGHLFA
jgi:hypothetical protein